MPVWLFGVPIPLRGFYGNTGRGKRILTVNERYWLNKRFGNIMRVPGWGVCILLFEEGYGQGAGIQKKAKKGNKKWSW